MDDVQRGAPVRVRDCTSRAMLLDFPAHGMKGLTPNDDKRSTTMRHLTTFEPLAMVRSSGDVKLAAKNSVPL